MSTAIAAQTIDWPSLAPDSRALQIIKANLDGEPMQERDLIRVRTPLGGATKWTIESDGETETVDEIVGLLVGEAKRGYIWPSQDPSEQPPVLFSPDLKNAYLVSRDFGDIDPKKLDKFRTGDGVYDWAAIALSKEFGYGTAGAGRRAKELRLLAVLRQDETWPLLVTISGGSLGVYTPWRKRLKAFHWECVVGLKCVKAKNGAGQPFTQVTPRLVGTISPEAGKVVRETYTLPLQAMFEAVPQLA